MAVELRPRVFISYSRVDGDFVDRLEADLRARDIDTWVDRRKLEGGQNWLDELQKALDSCAILLLVLSPDAVASDPVRKEYRYALASQKVVTPLVYRPCEKVPFELNDIQWIQFAGRPYADAFRDLLVDISRFGNGQPVHDSPTSHAILQSFQATEEPDLVTPQPAPPPPPTSLNELYMAGVKARSEGNLERTVVFWQQVLDTDPQFGNGALGPQFAQLMEELGPIRVRRLRERAEQAHRAGEWGQEVGAWQALLSLAANDAQAVERLPIAQHNQQYAWLYENARQFISRGDKGAARTQLEMLWRDAPFFGDPERLASAVGVRVPATYNETAARERQNAARDKQRQETEWMKRALLWGNYGAWTSALFSMAGFGGAVGEVSQSWIAALCAVVIACPILYLLAYRRFMSLLAMVGLGLISCILAYLLALHAAGLDYHRMYTGTVPWSSGVLHYWLDRQLIFGLAVGATCWLFTPLMYLPRATNGTACSITALPWAIWLVGMGIGSVFGLGFGYGPGWDYSLLGGLCIGSALVAVLTIPLSVQIVAWRYPSEHNVILSIPWPPATGGRRR